MIKHQIPDTPCQCLVSWHCVYRQNGRCEDPLTNKGNSDSACHALTSKYLQWQLIKIEQGG